MRRLAPVVAIAVIAALPAQPASAQLNEILHQVEGTPEAIQRDYVDPTLAEVERNREALERTVEGLEQLVGDAQQIAEDTRRQVEGLVPQLLDEVGRQLAEAQESLARTREEVDRQVASNSRPPSETLSCAPLAQAQPTQDTYAEGAPYRFVSRVACARTRSSGPSSANGTLVLTGTHTQPIPFLDDFNGLNTSGGELSYLQLDGDPAAIRFRNHVVMVARAGTLELADDGDPANGELVGYGAGALVPGGVTVGAFPNFAFEIAIRPPAP